MAHGWSDGSSLSNGSVHSLQNLDLNRICSLAGQTMVTGQTTCHIKSLLILQTRNEYLEWYQLLGDLSARSGPDIPITRSLVNQIRTCALLGSLLGSRMISIFGW